VGHSNFDFDLTVAHEGLCHWKQPALYCTTCFEHVLLSIAYQGSLFFFFSFFFQGSLWKISLLNDANINDTKPHILICAKGNMHEFKEQQGVK
jgi:hypothetical protein